MDYEKTYVEEFDVDEDEDEAIKLKIRLGFIKKVYGILLFQALLTTLVVGSALFIRDFANFIMNNPFMYILCFITCLILQLTLICCKSVSRKVPINYILLIIFTLSESYLVASSTLIYEPFSVFICSLITVVLVFGITLYACFTKKDFTLYGTTLCLLCLGLLCFSILGFFLRSRLYEIFICCAGVVLFGFYLVYDTQLVIGRNQKLISEDDYIG